MFSYLFLVIRGREIIRYTLKIPKFNQRFFEEISKGSNKMPVKSRSMYLLENTILFFSNNLLIMFSAVIVSNSKSNKLSIYINYITYVGMTGILTFTFISIFLIFKTKGQRLTIMTYNAQFRNQIYTPQSLSYTYENFSELLHLSDYEVPKLSKEIIHKNLKIQNTLSIITPFAIFVYIVFLYQSKFGPYNKNTPSYMISIVFFLITLTFICRLYFESMYSRSQMEKESIINVDSLDFSINQSKLLQALFNNSLRLHLSFTIFLLINLHWLILIELIVIYILFKGIDDSKLLWVPHQNMTLIGSSNQISFRFFEGTGIPYIGYIKEIPHLFISSRVMKNLASLQIDDAIKIMEQLIPIFQNKKSNINSVVYAIFIYVFSIISYYLISLLSFVSFQLKGGIFTPILFVLIYLNYLLFFAIQSNHSTKTLKNRIYRKMILVKQNLPQNLIENWNIIIQNIIKEEQSSDKIEKFQRRAGYLTFNELKKLLTI